MVRNRNRCTREAAAGARGVLHVPTMSERGRIGIDIGLSCLHIHYQYHRRFPLAYHLPLQIWMLAPSTDATAAESCSCLREARRSQSHSGRVAAGWSSGDCKFLSHLAAADHCEAVGLADTARHIGSQRMQGLSAIAQDVTGM